MLNGEDLVAIAQSGAGNLKNQFFHLMFRNAHMYELIKHVVTGKTLAFLLPVLIHAIPRCDQKGPNILILAPTIEVVQKIETEAAKYAFWGVKTYDIWGKPIRTLKKLPY